MADIIPPRYNFTTIEKEIYQKWKEHNCFAAAVNPDGTVRDQNRSRARPFVMAIPPPNVTGRLHMGHALNNTIQDMLIRYKRMDGYDALWVPGTDHAGIATQTVVKKMLDARQIDYRELGREKFVERIWEWKAKFGDIILQQLEKMGCSCDWQRTRFTMDKGLSRAVKKAFKKLYDQGLIYRGERIVNWCPFDRTALSDDEIETKEGGEPGYLWYIKYPFPDHSGAVTVATTRPETMFGDTAVAVNPDDSRYRHLHNRSIILPLMEKEIPVITDSYVDQSFGTGCLKITPAHDPHDFAIGQRHKLAAVTIMNEDATMNNRVPPAFRGMSREQCREAAVKALQEKGLLLKTEKRMTPVGRSYRSKAAIEYRLSKQWFVKMKPLAEKALQEHDQLNIQPRQWEKVYKGWLEKIQDWCISRQIWWGHRIPAWYNKQTGAVLVEETTPEPVKKEPDKWQQETDVLDTWFSSALWPLSILGWPEQTPDLKRYFPTSTLSTAKDIIFFWVARMNIMSLRFKNCMPYQNVYIHPTVMDKNGETMSKSKGNGIDPLHIIDGAGTEELKGPILDARPADMQSLLKGIEKNFPDGFPGVGADAMRYTLISLCSSGQELKVALSSFTEIGRRFITKLWNAARFLLHNMAAFPDDAAADFSQEPADEDLWIRHQLQHTVNAVRRAYDEYDFTHLGRYYYDFVWHDFCDWYIEICKIRLNAADEKERGKALYHLGYILSRVLQLLSPLIPFTTEKLWSVLKPLLKEKRLTAVDTPAGDILMLTAFPQHKQLSGDAAATIEKFAQLQRFVSLLRSFKTKYGIKLSRKLPVKIKVKNQAAQKLLQKSSVILKELGAVSTLDTVTDQPAGTAALIDPAFIIYIPLKGIIDIDKETARIQKEIGKVKQDLEFVNKKLSNHGFINNARAELVQKEKNKLTFLKNKLSSLEHNLDELQ